MEQSLQEQQKRWTELAQRAYSRCCYTYTEFLSLAEQDALSRLPKSAQSASWQLWGGYEEAERKLACFGSIELCSYEEAPPLSFVLISPVDRRFGEELGHRDYLGALLSLGLRRQVLGDIIVQDKQAYLICLEHVAPFIQEQLTQVRHTAVRCSLATELPRSLSRQPELSQVLVASERLDGLVAAVYHLSRSASQQLITQGRVFINDRECSSADATLCPGDRVSVRGQGRFIYEGIDRNTRKGRLRVGVRIF